MLKYLILLLSLFSVNSVRVIENKPLIIGGDSKTWSPQLIGGNPKTWSPSENYTVIIPVTLFDTDLDCSTCKIMLAALETDACSKCHESDKCMQMIQTLGDPTKICQLIGVCPKTSWFTKLTG